MARPKKDRVKVTLRLPPELHPQLVAAATESGRSLNAEIVQRLKASFESGSPRARESVDGRARGSNYKSGGLGWPNSLRRLSPPEHQPTEKEKFQ
jgi:hypothetical protein